MYPDCGPHLKKEECAFLPWAHEIIVQVPSRNLSSSSNGSPPSWWDIPDMNTSAYVAYKATHAHSRINHWLISVPGVGVDWDRLALWFVSCARSSHTCHYSHGHQNVGVCLPQARSNVRTKFRSFASQWELCSEGGLPQHSNASTYRFSWPQVEELLGVLLSCGPLQACVFLGSVG